MNPDVILQESVMTRWHGPLPECSDCRQAGTPACVRCGDGDLYEPSLIGRAFVATLLNNIKTGER